MRSRGVVPSFVAFPASTDEASALLRVAAAHDLSVVPRGAGTGLGWGLPPVSCDLVIDLQAMDQVIEHAAGDLVARVQAGATMGNLASVLASAGQQLAVDAPADATVGGVVATGTAGPRRFRYGAPRDLLIGITVVRADGVVAHSGGKVVKNVAGYDLGKLFSGSQGTLGLITEVTFRLHPLPAAVAWVTGDFGPCPPLWRARPRRWRRRRVPRWCRRRWSCCGRTPRPCCGWVSCWKARRPGWPNGPSRWRSCSPARGATVVATSETPFRWWQPEPGAPGTVVRVTFWVRQLAEVLGALATAGASTGIRPAVSGAAGAGVLYAWLDPGVADEAAARFVQGTARPAGGRVRRVRGRSGLPGRHGGTGRAGGGPGGGRPGQAGAWLDLMRAVKDQFDPGHRMCPGRSLGAVMQDAAGCASVANDCVHCGFCLPACPPTSCGPRRWTPRADGSTW